MLKNISATLLFLCFSIWIKGSDTFKIYVDDVSEGAPITLGIPFPMGVLQSPDHLRLLSLEGKEIPSQVTEVSNWEPLDFSIKWVWVFFFAEKSDTYIIEYGEGVSRARIEGPTIRIKNNQRQGRNTDVDTGPLKFIISKKEGGFIDHILFDRDGDGFDELDTIAISSADRGSFLDLFDDNGIDPSKAVVHSTVREKGSGPLHSIIRMEGNYFYSREDNRPSPFIIRLHVYADKSYIRVLHTMTYTGVPDKHTPQEGEHAAVATQNEKVIQSQRSSDDEGWTQPNDQIAALGISLDFKLGEQLKYSTGYFEGEWYDPGKEKNYNTNLGIEQKISIFQTGPNTSRIPPLPNSTTTERVEGYNGQININDETEKEFVTAPGWVDVKDKRWGIGVGIRHFFEEYPKEIDINVADQKLVAYMWSPKADPLSFARASKDSDSGMIANFSTGITKTSELVYYFHSSKSSNSEVEKTLKYVLEPSVAHADPEVYSSSNVYGQFSPVQESHSDLERGLEYRFDWNIFNQHWEPWYGFLDYGDHMNMYFRNDWFRWECNEPAIDYMLWLQFMRTGNRKYYDAADAMSRHTMDVDNTHWPKDPEYVGDTNASIDYLDFASTPKKATPYLGIGRRHSRQHFSALLSAHVWNTGWIAAYYLTGYHRGLEVAKMSGDTYIKRIWGEHDFRGRRLYLAAWNLAEIYDATKDPKYLDELNARVNTMLELQNGSDQYGSLVIDRYGYSNVYASQGLYKYYQITRDTKIKNALLRHARAVRDNPPYNHDYESYFSTIHSLVIAHELSGEDSFLDEAVFRAEKLKTDKLKKSFDDFDTQEEAYNAIMNVTNLPFDQKEPEDGRWLTIWGIAQGMRVFGWTHIYNVPWLLRWIRNEGRLDHICD